MRQIIGWILKSVSIILMLPYVALLLYSAFALALWLGGWLGVLVAFVMLPIAVTISPVIYLFIGQFTPFIFLVGGAFIIFTIYGIADTMLDRAKKEAI